MSAQPNQNINQADDFEPGFVFKEYDRGADKNHANADETNFEETAETECHRPHE